MTRLGAALWLISLVIPAWAVLFSENDRFRAFCLDCGAALLLVLWGGYIGFAIFDWPTWRWDDCLPIVGATIVWALMVILYQQTSFPGITFAERRRKQQKSRQA